jgi:hypothetical protein
MPIARNKLYGKTTVFIFMKQCSSGPTSLNLELSLATFSSYLNERLTQERRTNAIGGPSYVILVFAYGATISDRDYTASKQIISTFKQQNPGN